jgi:uncharacterized protein (TIGR02145 family)
MMLDGHGTWTEVNTYYNTGAANTDNAKINLGRTAHSGTGIGGRGICPVNWHVPTDYEWGVFFDAMEDGASTVHQGVSGNAWVGTNAGKRAKSACIGASSDTDLNWTNHDNKGVDLYSFRVLPAGIREFDGRAFYYRGTRAYFWSSSAPNSSGAWFRFFHYDLATVNRTNYGNRSLGYSIRCIRDL